MQLGRLGVWYPVDRLDAEKLRAFLGTIEQLGYDTLWYPESRGYESLSIAGFMLANSTTAEDRQFDRQHLRARCVHRPARAADVERAVWGAVHSRPRRQPSADGRGDAWP